VTTFKLKHKTRSLHYRVRGQGEDLLLIHGLGSSGADWEFQVRALERHFRVIVPDLPGSGYSPAFEGDFSICDCADVLWGLLDHLQIPRANIAGFSLGGAVALAGCPRLLSDCWGCDAPPDWQPPDCFRCPGSGHCANALLRR
jgi:pimeloyl-ACP methyl ester carboxylesterase